MLLAASPLQGKVLTRCQVLSLQEACPDQEQRWESPESQVCFLADFTFQSGNISKMLKDRTLTLSSWKPRGFLWRNCPMSWASTDGSEPTCHTLTAEQRNSSKSRCVR